MDDIKNYKCIVFGGNGNIGRTVVDYLLKSEKYTKITIFCRKELDRWKNLNKGEKNQTKMKIIHIESFDFLNNNNFMDIINEKLDKNIDYNTIFCCLGGRNESEYENVDYKLSIKISIIAEKLNIAHFSIISSENSDSNSENIFLKYRGKMEEDISKKNIKCISFFRTNYVTKKENPPILYWFLSLFYQCKNNSIECKNLGKAMVVNDLEVLNFLENGDEENNRQKIINNFKNEDIKKLSFKKI